MKKIILPFVMVFSMITLAQVSNVGINTTTPKKNFHINGSIQITKELNVGGDQSTSGDSGIKGQILVSNGPSEAPRWTNPDKVSGSLYNVFLKQGTGGMTLEPGNSLDVPGLDLTHEVPDDIKSQTLVFNVVGYAKTIYEQRQFGGSAYFRLYHNNELVSTCLLNIQPNEVYDFPDSCVLLYGAELSKGTKHNFKVGVGSIYSTLEINGLNFKSPKPLNARLHPFGESPFKNQYKDFMSSKMMVYVYNNK